MSQPRRALLVLIAATLIVAGCGQPAYRLTVRVTETDCAPIPQASVMLVGPQDTRLTDDDGRAAWAQLEEEAVILFVTADGYMAYTGRVELQRKRNETVVALERAPSDPDIIGP